MKTTNPKTNSRRIRRHAAQRGAAMIEGVVVMVTMFVFLGMNLWVARTYGGKLDQANSTRRDVLYFASHACKGQSGDPDTYAVPGLKGNAGPAISSSEGLGSAEGADKIDQVGGQVGAGVERSWNSVSGGKSGNVRGDAATWMTKTPLAANLTTNSYATCNEKRYDGVASLFSFGFDFLKSAAGVF